MHSSPSHNNFLILFFNRWRDINLGIWQGQNLSPKPGLHGPCSSSTFVRSLCSDRKKEGSNLNGCLQLCSHGLPPSPWRHWCNHSPPGFGVPWRHCPPGFGALLLLMGQRQREGRLSPVLHHLSSWLEGSEDRFPPINSN